MYFQRVHSSADGITSKTVLEIGLSLDEFRDRVEEFDATGFEELGADRILLVKERSEDQARVLQVFQYQEPWQAFFAWLLSEGVEITHVAQYTFGIDHPDPKLQSQRDLINKTRPDFVLAGGPDSCDQAVSMDADFAAAH